MPKLIAMDLDGTLTQHRTPLEDENRAVLTELKKKYTLMMVGAGACARIFKQMGNFPINILGNYGMQYAEYNEKSGELEVLKNEIVPADHDEIMRRMQLIRDRYDLHTFAGEPMEFHATGMLTLPILGTKAKIEDKLAYDPDRAKRRVMYPYVKELFYDYNVMIGGSSSFDIVPGAFGKLNALRRYMAEHQLTDADIIYCGDDYAEGGNDHDVYAGGIPFIKVDSYHNFGKLIKENGLL